MPSPVQQKLAALNFVAGAETRLEADGWLNVVEFQDQFAKLAGQVSQDTAISELKAHASPQLQALGRTLERSLHRNQPPASETVKPVSSFPAPPKVVRD